MACLAATSFGPDPSSRRQRPWDDLGQILGNDLGPDRVPEVVLGGDGSPPDSTVSTTTLLDPSHEGEDETLAASVTSTTTRLDPPLEGEEYDDDDKDDSVEDAVLDPEPEGAEDEPDPTAELKRLAEENAELRRQLAASAKGGDA